MNLETIVGILVDNAEILKGRYIDMSMFIEKEVPQIYAMAAERMLERGDFDMVLNYLCLGKQWESLLELGVRFFHSSNKEEKEVGKNFLQRLAQLYSRLPKKIAIELADYILEQGGTSCYKAAVVLGAGNAEEEARAKAYHFFNEGNFESGRFFVTRTNKKFTPAEVARFAGAALERGRYDDAFKIYELESLAIPKDRAIVIANSYLNKPDYNFYRVVEYMDKTGNPFSFDEFKNFADTLFRSGNPHMALRVYERAGKVTPEDYKLKGEELLGWVMEVESKRDVFSLTELWPTITTAFAYLSKGNPEEAKQRLVQYADSLLDQPDLPRRSPNVCQFHGLYKLLNEPIPISKALKVAALFEEKGKFEEAAELYARAGDITSVKRVGSLALKNDSGYREDVSIKVFSLARDDEGLAITRFIKKNLARP